MQDVAIPKQPPTVTAADLPRRPGPGRWAAVVGGLIALVAGAAHALRVAAGTPILDIIVVVGIGATILAIWGAALWIGSLLRSDAWRLARHQEILRDVLLSSLVTAAAVDGKLTESEIVLIQQLVGRLTGLGLTARQVAGAVRGGGGGAERRAEILQGVRDRGKDIAPHLKPFILEATALVIAADGTVEADERAFLADLSAALGEPSEWVNRRMRAFEKSGVSVPGDTPA